MKKVSPHASTLVIQHLSHTSSTGFHNIVSSVWQVALCVFLEIEMGGVTEANMMQYLSIIERGTNKLLSDYTNQASTMGDEDETALAFATVDASQVRFGMYRYFFYTV